MPPLEWWRDEREKAAWRCGEVGPWRHDKGGGMVRVDAFDGLLPTRPFMS